MLTLRSVYQHSRLCNGRLRAVARACSPPSGLSGRLACSRTVVQLTWHCQHDNVQRPRREDENAVSSPCHPVEQALARNGGPLFTLSGLFWDTGSVQLRFLTQLELADVTRLIRGTNHFSFPSRASLHCGSSAVFVSLRHRQKLDPRWHSTTASHTTAKYPCFPLL
jgi:hypothetical protein